MAKKKRLDPKLAKRVKERSGGICEICGMRQATEIHHIFFGWGIRRLSEILECLIDLCCDCHRGNGANQKGVHFNKKLDDRLKRNAQKQLIKQGYTEDEVRIMTGGQLYL